jgi:ketosteroid isomerase-like protein
MQYYGWAEYQAGLMKTFIDGMCRSRFVPNDDLKVTRLGTVARTMVTFQISAKLKAGGSLELDGRHTAIWERRGEKWLIVHERLSSPLRG